MLEIHIKESVKVFDNYDSAIAEVQDVIKKWFDSEIQEPLTITLVKKGDNRGPPVLSIKVNDNLNVRSILR